MATSADHDVTKAVIARWNGQNVGDTITGGIYDGKISTPRPTMPYTKLTVGQARDPDQSSGGDYIDYRRVLFQTWIVGKEAAETPAHTIRTAFKDQALNPVNSTFLRCELKRTEIKEDENAVEGDDVRIIEQEFWVWTHRTS